MVWWLNTLPHKAEVVCSIPEMCLFFQHLLYFPGFTDTFPGSLLEEVKTRALWKRSVSLLHDVVFSIFSIISITTFISLNSPITLSLVRAFDLSCSLSTLSRISLSVSASLPLSILRLSISVSLSPSPSLSLSLSLPLSLPFSLSLSLYYAHFRVLYLSVYYQLGFWFFMSQICSKLL